jgi:uncharacterized membrane protein YqjE
LISLLGGIVTDAKRMISGELALVKLEVQEEIAKTKVATTRLAMGLAVGVVGFLLLVLMLVHILNTFAGLPLWGAYGTLGGFFVAVGAALLYASKKKQPELKKLPEQTIGKVREDLRWINNQMKSNGR